MKLRQIVWFIALLSTLLASLSAGWLIQASRDYAYPFWYDQYDIAAHIDRFGPQNRYIQGLQTLPKDEHVRLFDDIVRAVHHHGEGLGDIRFITDGISRPLLRQPEIEHLQDVANLIDVLRPAGLGAALLALLLLRGLMRRKIRPHWRTQAMLLGSFTALLLAILFLAGPRQVFYQLHVWIFPDNHQWFFYYQDSLMSTLMKAPQLFAGIAMAIMASGLLIYALLIVLLLFWQHRISAGRP